MSRVSKAHAAGAGQHGVIGICLPASAVFPGVETVTAPSSYSSVDNFCLWNHYLTRTNSFGKGLHALPEIQMAVCELRRAMVRLGTNRVGDVVLISCPSAHGNQSLGFFGSLLDTATLRGVLPLRGLQRTALRVNPAETLCLLVDLDMNLTANEAHSKGQVDDT
jgi:hypothetical protein